MEMNRKIWRVILFGMLVLLFLGGWWLSNFMKVDACLDSGGSWDYQNAECDLTK